MNALSGMPLLSVNLGGVYFYAVGMCMSIDAKYKLYRVQFEGEVIVLAEDDQSAVLFAEHDIGSYDLMEQAEFHATALDPEVDHIYAYYTSREHRSVLPWCGDDENPESLHVGDIMELLKERALENRKKKEFEALQTNLFEKSDK